MEPTERNPYADRNHEMGGEVIDPIAVAALAASVGSVFQKDVIGNTSRGSDKWIATQQANPHKIIEDLKKAQAAGVVRIAGDQPAVSAPAAPAPVASFTPTAAAPLSPEEQAIIEAEQEIARMRQRLEEANRRKQEQKVPEASAPVIAALTAISTQLSQIHEVLVNINTSLSDR